MYIGTPYTHFEKQARLQDLSKEWFEKKINTGLSYFNFKKVMKPVLPPDNIDLGIINHRHWYLTEYGYVCWAYNLYGFVGKTRLAYYGHDVKTDTDPRAYLLPYNDVSTAKYQHIWFLNRSQKPSKEMAIHWFISDREKAKKRYENKKFKPLNYKEQGRYESNLCANGVYYDEFTGNFMIEKVDVSHRYFFVDWLSGETIDMIKAILPEEYKNLI